MPRLSRRAEYLALLGITALAAFLRLYRLDALPPGDGHDVAQYGVDALQILAGARPVFLESNFGREPLFSYLVALVYTLTGPGTFGIHLTGALIGTLTIPAVFLAARELFAEARDGAMAYLPLLAAFLSAVSYWHLNWSRVGLRVILVPLFASLVVWALWRGFRYLDRPDGPRAPTRTAGWFLLAGALLGLSLYTYQAARLLPLLAAAAFALRALWRRRWTRRDMAGALLVSIAALIVFLPLGYYARQHPGALSVRIRQATVFDPATPLRLQAGEIAAQALTALATYSFTGDADPQFTIPGRPSLYPFLSAALFAGIGVALWRFRRSPYLFLPAWLAIMTAPAMVADLAATAKRYLGAFPAVMMLAALGLLLPWEWLRASGDRQRTTDGGRQTASGLLTAVVCRLWPVVIVSGLVYTTAATWRDYFVVWAADPDLPTHFQADHAAIGAAIAALAPAQPVWLSPYPPDQPVIQLHAGLRPDLRGYNGRFCVPYTDPVGPEGMSWVIVPGLQDASLARLQALFPNGDTTNGPSRPGADRPYYRIFRAPPGASPVGPPLRTAVAVWDGRIELLGYETDQARAAPGRTVAVSLIYRATDRPETNLTAFVHLLGPAKPDGSPLWAQSDSEPCGGALPTSRWQAGDIIRDTVSLAIPPDAPDGVYRLVTGFYTWPDLTRVADDLSGADAVSLGEITVTRP